MQKIKILSINYEFDSIESISRTHRLEKKSICFLIKAKFITGKETSEHEFNYGGNEIMRDRDYKKLHKLINIKI